MPRLTCEKFEKRDLFFAALYLGSRGEGELFPDGRLLFMISASDARFVLGVQHTAQNNVSSSRCG